MSPGAQRACGPRPWGGAGTAEPPAAEPSQVTRVQLPPREDRSGEEAAQCASPAVTPLEPRAAHALPQHGHGAQPRGRQEHGGAQDRVSQPVDPSLGRGAGLRGCVREPGPSAPGPEVRGQVPPPLRNVSVSPEEAPHGDPVGGFLQTGCRGRRGGGAATMLVTLSVVPAPVGTRPHYGCPVGGSTGHRPLQGVVTLACGPALRPPAGRRAPGAGWEE